MSTTPKAPRKPKLGDCYRWAAMNATEEYDRVMHGVIALESVNGGTPFGHAWIERGAYVLDWQNRKNPERILRLTFYRTFRPTDVREYSQREAMVLMLKHNHFGPWEGDE